MHQTARNPGREQVVLAGVLLSGTDAALFEQDMQEMALLCRTAGVEVAGRVVQRRNAPAAATFIGTGKLTEIRSLMTRCGAHALIVDAELSPGQVRSIEQAVEGKVLDRAQLILDIFARHASSSEARIQVELAQMRTLYPRLTRAWSHFSRQYAGVGTKGPGEKQLELDRRMVQKRIAELTRKLTGVERSRDTQRQGRRGMTRVALVGYTNVGKTSLLNRLTRAGALVENRLFATLDTTTRRLFLAQAGSVALSDTVGFLRKLPHHLLASFRSTLVAALDTDALLLVHDASSEWAAAQRDTVESVLDELGAVSQTRVHVLNKADRIAGAFEKKRLAAVFPDAVFVSAQSGEGIDALKERLGDALNSREREINLTALIARKSESYRPAPPGPPPLPEASVKGR